MIHSYHTTLVLAFALAASSQVFGAADGVPQNPACDVIAAVSADPIDQELLKIPLTEQEIPAPRIGSQQLMPHPNVAEEASLQDLQDQLAAALDMAKWLPLSNFTAYSSNGFQTHPEALVGKAVAFAAEIRQTSNASPAQGMGGATSMSHIAGMPGGLGGFSSRAKAAKAVIFAGRVAGVVNKGDPLGMPKWAIQVQPLTGAQQEFLLMGIEDLYVLK